MLATSKTANGILSHDTCKNNRLILSKREHLSHHHNFISEKYSLIVTRLLLFQMHKKHERLHWLVCLIHPVFNHCAFLLFCQCVQNKNKFNLCNQLHHQRVFTKLPALLEKLQFSHEVNTQYFYINDFLLPQSLCLLFYLQIQFTLFK